MLNCSEVQKYGKINNKLLYIDYLQLYKKRKKNENKQRKLKRGRFF